MAEDYGIKVSVPGKSVYSNDPLDISFKSDLDLLKVALSGSGTMSGTTATISHGLGYIPQFLVFGEVNFDLGNGEVFELATGDFWDQLIAGADTNNLYIYSNNGNKYTYYIFYESIDGTPHSAIVSSNNYGMKVMKAGNNINSLDLDKQALNSEKNNLKIAQKGYYETTAIDTDFHQVLIAHELPYTPGIMMWFQIGNDGKYYAGSSGSNIIYNQVDTKNITFTYFDLPTNTSIKLYYLLFVENPL